MYYDPLHSFSVAAVHVIKHLQIGQWHKLMELSFAASLTKLLPTSKEAFVSIGNEDAMAH